MKKYIAMLLTVAMMAFPLTAYASSDTTDGAETTEAATESPLQGKKVAYIMYMSSATIFQMWSDSFTATAGSLRNGSQHIFLAMTMPIPGRAQSSSVHRAAMMD